MARHDIMPYSSPLGGTTEIVNFSIGIGTSSATEDTSWRAGNIVILDAAVGDVNPATDGTLEPGPGLHYLALVDSASIIAHYGLTDPVAAGEFAMVPCVPLTKGQEFTTAFISSGDDTQLGLDTATVLIGATADLWVDDSVATVDGHIHGLDIAGNFFMITRKLDALGRDSLISGAATTKLVFRSMSQLVA